MGANAKISHTRRAKRAYHHIGNVPRRMLVPVTIAAAVHTHATATAAASTAATAATTSPSKAFTLGLVIP